MSVPESFKKIIRAFLERFNLKLTRTVAPRECDPVARAIVRGPSALQHNTKENMDAFYADADLLTHYFTEERLAFYQSVQQHLADLRLKPADMLDVGCGSGHLLAALTGLYPNAAAAGVDFSSAAIDMARRLHSGPNFEVLSIFDLGNLEKQYDLVICTEVLEHLEHADLAIENLLAVCRRGGTVVITVPDGRQDTFVGHFNFWTPESFAREFRKHGPMVEVFGSYLFIAIRRSDDSRASAASFMSCL